MKASVLLLVGYIFLAEKDKKWMNFQDREKISIAKDKDRKYALHGILSLQGQVLNLLLRAYSYESLIQP